MGKLLTIIETSLIHRIQAIRSPVVASEIIAHGKEDGDEGDFQGEGQ